MIDRGIFELSSRRIEEALAAGTLDARDDRHFTWSPLLLDRIGWERAVAGIDELSRCVFEERTNAAWRMARSGEEPIRATVVLAVFESPHGPSDVRSLGRAVEERTLSPGEARALAAPVRLEIVERAIMRDVSPVSFLEESGGGSARGVDRHFETLRRTGWLRLATERAGASVDEPGRRLYRIGRAPLLRADAWVALPATVKAMVSARTFASYQRQVEEAMTAGTLDARRDRRCSWTVVPVDRHGWEALTARADALLESLLAEQRRTKLRLVASGEEPSFGTVALAVFESPDGQPAAP